MKILAERVQNKNTLMQTRSNSVRVLEQYRLCGPDDLCDLATQVVAKQGAIIGVSTQHDAQSEFWDGRGRSSDIVELDHLRGRRSKGNRRQGSLARGSLRRRGRSERGSGGDEKSVEETTFNRSGKKEQSNVGRKRTHETM